MKILLDFMAQHGLPLNEEPCLDGTLHRYSGRPEKPTDRDEWYIGFHEDNFIYCTFGTWRNGSMRFTYKSSDNEEVDTEIQRRIQEIKERTLREIDEKRQEAVRKALDIMAESQDIESHPYLTKKKVPPENIRLWKGNIVIPIYDIDGNIMSVQRIDENGSKRFLLGSKVLGGMLTLGKPSDRILVAEGYATAKSLRDALDCCVVIGFSAHNLPIVGEMLKRKYPQSSIELCADLGKAGQQCSDKWKKVVGTTPHYPRFEPQHGNNTDFNDMACLYGNESIVRLLGRSITGVGFEAFIKQQCDPLEWSVDNMFTKGSVNMIYGGEGVGKTWFGLELAFCCSTGEQFFASKTMKQRVLYIDGEMLNAELVERIKNILRRYNRTKTRGDNIIRPDEAYMTYVTQQDLERKKLPEIDLFSTQSRNMLNTLISDHDIIIFDNLWNLTICGDMGEDTLMSDTSWAKISSWFRRLKSMGKTVIYLHHKNKGGDSFGSRRIKADPTTIIRLDSIEDNFSQLSFKIVIEKGRNILNMYKRPLSVSLSPEESQYNNGWVLLQS